MTSQNQKATYVCINQEETYIPGAIQTKSICVRGDIGATLEQILSLKHDLEAEI